MSDATNDTTVINCTCGEKAERGEELRQIEGSDSRFFMCKRCNGCIVVLGVRGRAEAERNRQALDLPDWLRPTTKQAVWIATQLVRETGRVVHVDTPYGPVRVDDELERLGNAMPDYLIDPVGG